MKSKGFTLIELVVVIVILGILAVVAAPKFMGLQRDARIADLKGLEGSLKAANEMVYAKAAMKGLENDSQLEINSHPSSNQINIGGHEIFLHYGHINVFIENIENILNIDFANDWKAIALGQGMRGNIYMTPKTASAFNATSYVDIKKSECYLSYSFGEKSPWKIPQYKLVTSGC